VAPKTAEGREDRARKLWEIIDDIAKHSADLVIPSIEILNKQGLVLGIKESHKAFARIHKILEQSKG